VEFFYINHQDKFSNTWYYDRNEKKYYDFDSANYLRKKAGVNLNYNLILHITKNIAFNQKIGFGYRRRNVMFSNVLNQTEIESFDDFDSFLVPASIENFIRHQGVITGLNFNLDFKLIYMF